MEFQGKAYETNQEVLALMQNQLSDFCFVLIDIYDREELTRAAMPHIEAVRKALREEGLRRAGGAL